MTLQVSCHRAFSLAKLCPLSNAQNFPPLRGLTGWRLAAQEIFLTGEARAQKPLENHAGAESTRLVVLVPEIKVRRSWDILEEHTPHRSASSRGFDRCAERHGFLLA